MIGKLFGHTQVATTARYAHLAADPVKVAAEQVSSAIAKSIFGTARKRLPYTGKRASTKQDALGKARESPRHQSLLPWAGRIRLLQAFERFAARIPLERVPGLGFPRLPARRTAASRDGPAAP